jgi:hypothetical protein
MIPLPNSVSDDQLIAFVDEWAALLEREDYEAAFSFTDHVAAMNWTASLVREVIKSYGDADSGQKMTVHGVPSDVAQRKQVERWPTNAHGCFGEIWYGLNINGKASDLTALFALKWADGGVIVCLDDIHVM